MMEYNPKAYWEQRLSKNLDIATVGSLGLGCVYNYWLYKARFRAMERALAKLSLNLNDSDKSLLEIGVGSGAWIPFWQRKGVSQITGLDITSASIRTLRERYPNFRFIQGDICSTLPFVQEGSFDLVTAFDVLFHVVEDVGFSNAVSNIARMVNRDGWVMISDSFCEKPWGPFYHEYHRSRDHYLGELGRTGLRAIHLEPIFFTMTSPICASEAGYAGFLAQLTNSVLHLVSKLAAHKKTERFNHLIGCCLYLIDGAFGQVAKAGPSLKILFARKD
jgi:SAM-dependent methyltransferase